MSDAEAFSQRVLAWFDRHGRKELPWQEQRTPYRVWLSEIMLQQTQVQTVIPYFLRFTQAFPNIQALADAEEDRVMSLWSGLGYYARARNLHRCARMVVAEYQGNFPDNLEQLQSLPGIGRSTAGAILSQAFQKRGVILDGNVKRVLSRYAAIQGWAGQSKIQKQLWELAGRYTPISRPADYTQAMMDLGAMICTRRTPQCLQCPLQSDCEALRLDLVDEIPAKKPRKSLPERQVRLLVCRSEHGILLEKRPPSGIWGGLWSLPEAAQDISVDDLETQIGQRYGVDCIKATIGSMFHHTFTHFRLQIEPWYIEAKAAAMVQDGLTAWFNEDELKKLGMPAPVDRLLSDLIVNGKTCN